MSLYFSDTTVPFSNLSSETMNSLHSLNLSFRNKKVSPYSEVPHVNLSFWFPFLFFMCLFLYLCALSPPSLLLSCPCLLVFHVLVKKRLMNVFSWIVLWPRPLFQFYSKRHALALILEYWYWNRKQLMLHWAWTRSGRKWQGRLFRLTSEID